MAAFRSRNKTTQDEPFANGLLGHLGGAATLARMKTAVPLAALLSLTACDGGDKPPAAKGPQYTQEQVEARADEVYATFRQFHDNLPDSAAPPMTCPDGEIQKWAAKKNQVSFLAYQSLRYTLGEPWDGNNSMVRFMTKSNLRYPPRSEFKLDKERNVKQLMRMWEFVEYVGVVVPLKERQANAIAGTAVGKGGSLEAQLVIYKKGEPDPICHSPFKVESSGDASYTYKVGDNSSAKQSKATMALKRALCSEISTGLKTLITSLSKELKPESIDCNSV